MSQWNFLLSHGPILITTCEDIGSRLTICCQLQTTYLNKHSCYPSQKVHIHIKQVVVNRLVILDFNVMSSIHNIICHSGLINRGLLNVLAQI